MSEEDIINELKGLREDLKFSSYQNVALVICTLTVTIFSVFGTECVYYNIFYCILVFISFTIIMYSLFGKRKSKK